MQLRPIAEARGFLYCYPEGLLDRDGFPYWNGTDVNDLWSDHVDDAGYLRGLIQEISREFAVDEKQMCFIGHSTGGEMAYTMACQSAELVAGIATLGGNTFLDPGRCQPSEPVNVLSIDGTRDEWNIYWGGAWSGPGGTRVNMPPIPARCGAPRFGLSITGPKIQSQIQRRRWISISIWRAGHRDYALRELPARRRSRARSIIGGKHIPTLQIGNSSSEFSARVIDWLLAHPKP
jgi:hypothetical protein